MNKLSSVLKIQYFLSSYSSLYIAEKKILSKKEVINKENNRKKRI